MGSTRSSFSNIQFLMLGYKEPKRNVSRFYRWAKGGSLLIIGALFFLLLCYVCTKPDTRRRLVKDWHPYQYTVYIVTFIVITILFGCLYFLVKARVETAKIRMDNANIAP